MVNGGIFFSYVVPWYMFLCCTFDYIGPEITVKNGNKYMLEVHRCGSVSCVGSCHPQAYMGTKKVQVVVGGGPDHPPPHRKPRGRGGGPTHPPPPLGDPLGGGPTHHPPSSGALSSQNAHFDLENFFLALCTGVHIFRPCLAWYRAFWRVKLTRCLFL